MIINRPIYLNQLIESQNNGLIKIITGLRRCGKSYLLFRIFAEHLRSQGIKENHIIKIDLEDIRRASLRHPETLVAYIDEQIKDRDNYYVLLDEVQYVANFHEALNSYLNVDNVDVYVTGSNSKFLSSDIATEFRGRGDVIHIYPLSFSEYYSAVGGDKSEAWRNYFTFGGLPHVVTLDSHQKKIQYLQNLYSTVYLKDLLERQRISKAREFDELVEIVASTIGAPCNPSKLSNTFKSLENSDLSPHTIRNYLEYLMDAFLIEKAQRYDVKGRKYVNSLFKLYVTDTGVRNAILHFRQQEESHLMENIIYNELRIRGFSVDVGVVEYKGKDVNNQWIRKKFEVDFVANMGFKRYYIQSALTIPDDDKLRQESNSLSNINDDFKKIIIVRDYILPWQTTNGILVLGLFDFLLNPRSLEL